MRRYFVIVILSTVLLLSLTSPNKDITWTSEDILPPPSSQISHKAPAKFHAYKAPDEVHAYKAPKDMGIEHEPKEVHAYKAPPEIHAFKMPKEVQKGYKGDQTKGKIYKNVHKEIHKEFHKEKVKVPSSIRREIKSWKSDKYPSGYHRGDAKRPKGRYRSKVGGGGKWHWMVFDIVKGTIKGSYREYYPNGMLKIIAYYNPSAEGWVYTYHDNGQLAVKNWVKDGKAEGWVYKYHENGQLAMKFWAREGKAEGWVYKYHENGQLAMKFWAREGKAEGWVYKYHPNGQLRMKYWGKNGEASGWTYYYDQKGKLTKKIYW